MCDFSFIYRIQSIPYFIVTLTLFCFSNSMVIRCIQPHSMGIGGAADLAREGAMTSTLQKRWQITTLDRDVWKKWSEVFAQNGTPPAHRNSNKFHGTQHYYYTAGRSRPPSQHSIYFTNRKVPGRRLFNYLNVQVLKIVWAKEMSH